MFDLKRVSMLVIALMLAIFAIGCPDEEVVDEEDVEVEEELEEEEIVIGFTGPLSGPAAEYGEENRDGLDMAIRDLNEAGGIIIDNVKYTFRLEALDDGADPSQAVSNAQRLKDSYDVPAVYNPVATGVYPTLEYNEEEGNEFIMMAHTSEPGEFHVDNDLVMWTVPPYTVYVQSMGDMAWELGWRDAAMLVTAGAYGDGYRKSFETYWEEDLGGNIVADHPANYYEQTDFATEITSIRAQDTDVMLIGGPSAVTALVIEQAREMGYDGGFIIIDQAKLGYMEHVLDGRDLLEDAIGVIPVEDAYTPGAEEFTEKIADSYNPAAVVWEHSNAYIPMLVLAKAMEEAGTVDDIYAIRETMPEVFPLLDKDVEFPLANEYYGISEDGRLLNNAAITRVEDGEYLDPGIIITWFAETEEEFNQVNETMTLEPGTSIDDLDIRWLEGRHYFYPLVD